MSWLRDFEITVTIMINEVHNKKGKMSHIKFLIEGNWIKFACLKNHYTYYSVVYIVIHRNHSGQAIARKPFCRHMRELLAGRSEQPRQESEIYSIAKWRLFLQTTCVHGQIVKMIMNSEMLSVSFLLNYNILS